MNLESNSLILDNVIIIKESIAFMRALKWWKNCSLILDNLIIKGIAFMRALKWWNNWSLILDNVLKNIAFKRA